MTLRPILLGLAALCATPALAQAVSALKGHNSNAPVDVEADRIEVQDRADRAVFSGSVRVKQGDLNLNAARLTVAYAGQASTGSGVDIKRLDASGGVVVRSPTETAQGQFAVYDLDRRLITMLGGVTLDRQGNQVKGQRLVLDLNTGRATVDGGVVGGGGAGAVSGASGGGRVTGHFTVRQNAQTQ